MSPSRFMSAIFLALGISVPLWASDPTPQQIEHFERSVRPILVEHCYSCHSADAKRLRGGLRVDGRKHLIDGGDTGPSVIPGDPANSRLIEAIRYKNVDLLMPPKGKLPDNLIRVLENWVKEGAVWPVEQAAKDIRNEFNLANRKREHWAWQQLQPSAKNSGVDELIGHKLTQAGLTPAPPTNKLTLLRRVTYALTGLPPTPEDVVAFEADTSPDAYTKVVDRLLSSPHFGERWGRHWLDLVRYAESRGHEFEPDIPNAYQYRDYIVRALNTDVPYNQLVLEHLAGDLLPEPRLDPKTRSNESAIGPGFWHLGEEVHSPVDIRQDQADRFDNRIDVATKAFLGLTVSCARCHDHKFDAISTKDYYALFGLLEGASYRQVRIDGWNRNREVATELAKLRQDAHELSKDVKESQRSKQSSQPSSAYKSWLADSKTVIDYSNLRPGEWLPDDVTFGDGPRQAGFRYLHQVDHSWKFAHEHRTAAVYDPFWKNLKLAPNTSNDYGPLGKMTRAGFSIRTPSFVLEKKKLHYLIRGGGMAYAAVAQHAVLGGPLHQTIINTFKHSDEYRWVTHDLTGYVGQRLHVELTADPRTPFAIALVIQSDNSPPDIPPAANDLSLYNNSNDSHELVASLVKREYELAIKVKWESRLVLSMWDGPAVDSPVFVRGNPRTPGVIVPHRSLEALVGSDRLQHTFGSGRLELAYQWISEKQNPLIARVAVNRIWHHLFGRGLVASTDNFGVLGEQPTHQELLDHLANQFVADGWSLKRMIRRLVCTETYRMSSTAQPNALRIDPANNLLHSFRLKRLDGEAIRDAMLSISGRLDRSIGGPSVPIHLTPFLDGRGKPTTSGPLDGNGRRSLYLAVRRNFLSPLLLAFDTPIPFSTVGRRQISNVPAQALILMNDPFVHEQAEQWAKAVLAKPNQVEVRVTGMYQAAFGRSPTPEERRVCTDFVKGKEDDLTAWKDLAHTLFNVKEFVFIR